MLVLVLMFLLGSLVTIALGITANLLTPGMYPLWATVVSRTRRGLAAQTRQKLKVLQAELERLNRFQASDRDLYLYLFQFLLAIIGFLVAAVVCAFLAFGGATPDIRRWLADASFTFLIFALACCAVILRYCSECTVAGMQKKRAKLEGEVAKLTAALSESRPK